ncbi:IPT/TIG domain-containing protein [Catalinimonas niigatensis]|uniref:IPT/TIG domain-containing protein n=1 Tax=Catalinimonas niigatensis TaxID=1397264 RepID=UPI002666D3E0|nr:IPT/TIG domain-containing protein [Catalinimonas niigatensis]WPP51744.1 IPT/TIG domain-containing protein [Catalinimonas niigatensis]
MKITSISKALTKSAILFAFIPLLLQCKEDNGDPTPDPEPPTITSISPTSGPLGTEVTINGTNFSTDGTQNTIQFNGTPAAAKSASVSQLVVDVPSGATTGNVTVKVNGQTANGPVFTVEEEPDNIYDCSESEITASITWEDISAGDAVDYVIQCAISITNDAVLTIAPGVIIQFEGEESGLFTSDGGGLKAIGTEDNPIRLMGTSEQKGVWQGIYFASTHPENRLEYVEVMHAGRTASTQSNVKGAVQLTRGDESRASIVNCTIQDNDGYGVFITEGSNLEAFSGNVIAANELSPVGIYFSNLPMLDATSIYSPDNGQAYIEVKNDIFDTDGTVHRLEVPFRFVDNSRYYVESALTIEAGATLEFASGSALRLGDQGNDCGLTTASLNAVGTEESPITFKGVADGNGSWLGIGINSSSPNNQLMYCNISGGGAGKIFNADHESANLVLQCESRVKIQNSTLSESGGHGMVIHDEDASLVEFEENMLINNEASPIALYFHQLDQLDTASAYEEGNGNPYIKVSGSVLDENDMTLAALDVPYRVGVSTLGRILYVERALTILPGVIMEFETASGIKLGNPSADCVDNTGSLNAVGTADSPITFKGVTEGQGTWRGIGINSSTSANHLAFCEISGGGSEQMYNAGGQGNIVMQCAATLTVENCIIIDSGAWGIDFVSGGNALNETDNTFDNNASGDIAGE